MSEKPGIFTRWDAYLRSDKQPLVTENWRFFGFVNDVGEALHSFLPKSLYIGSYVVTGAYAVGAVYYDRQKMIDNLKKDNDHTEQEKQSMLTRRTMNCSFWHLLATVAITPLLVIPAVKAGTRRLLMQKNVQNHMREKVIPAAVGILSIPAVVSPVDNAVTYIMNKYNSDLPPEAYHWNGFWSGYGHHEKHEKKE